MSSLLDQALETASKDGTLEGVVAIGANRKGTIYSKSFGIEPNAVMWIASCTKLLTTIAALQCVERGLVSLEDDITLLLPELANLKILTGINENGEGIFKERTRPITLTHLLTHSAGLCYPDMNPNLQKYVGEKKIPIWNLPLVYEPGTDWIYSTSIDWAGKLVETLSRQTLDEYFQQHIFEPLGIKDMTFWLDSRQDMKSRLMEMKSREDDKLVNYTLPIPLDVGNFGGHGLFATIPEYIKVLQSLLINDEKLVSKQTRENMFKGHLGLESKKRLQDTSYMLTGNPPEFKVDWGLGGLMSCEDKGPRKAGTMTWGGMPNLAWFVDPAVGLCGIFGTQVLPPGDKKAQDIANLVEKALYDIAKE